MTRILAWLIGLELDWTMAVIFGGLAFLVSSGIAIFLLRLSARS
jgi:hypothetical protein